MNNKMNNNDMNLFANHMYQQALKFGKNNYNNYNYQINNIRHCNIITFFNSTKIKGQCCSKTVELNYPQIIKTYNKFTFIVYDNMIFIIFTNHEKIKQQINKYIDNETDVLTINYDQILKNILYDGLLYNLCISSKVSHKYPSKCTIL